MTEPLTHAEERRVRPEPAPLRRGSHPLSDPAALAMAAFAVPLFIWSAFNAGYFDLGSERFIIPPRGVLRRAARGGDRDVGLLAARRLPGDGRRRLGRLLG